ncbi:MAG TPA: hypothetical protein VHF86_01495, partial [Xanthomonadaceae bacterium]|nr:hypothetical protein [Xanthomonadaceae bacterium]
MAPARPLRTVLGAFCALPLCLAGTVWAQSPATPPPSPALQDAAALGEPAEPIAAEEVIAVPAWLDALVRERVIEPTSSREERLKRLVELLFGADGLALEYDGGRTRTITQSAE